MGTDSGSRLLIALILLAAASGSPATSVDADFSAPWKDPAGRNLKGVSGRIEPVWTRINIWLPWKRWDPSQPSTLPRFEPFVSEAALVMATGARPDGDMSVPDLYRDSAGVMLPFDPSHPFFNVLRILTERGIRPVIDIGPVPAALSPGGKAVQGPFQWNVAGAADAEKHYTYIKALFTFLRTSAGFSRGQLAGWGYQLYREPDNRDAFNPRNSGANADMGNLDAYKGLYDCTLAALRDAGIDAPLAPGNLLLPLPGLLEFRADSWTSPLLAWLASGDNRCPEHLSLPRFRPGKDTLDFGFSAYGGVAGSQLGMDPRKLASLTDKLRFLAESRFPGVAVRMVAAEGNLMDKTHLNRSEGTARGAAWNAAIYKIAQDEGLHRYQQWGFVSADHISRFAEHGGLPSAPHNVAQMFRRMQGENRAALKLKRGPLTRIGSYLDAIASGSDSVRHILIFRFDAAETGETGGRPDVKENVEVSVAGLRPGRGYSIRHLRVDADHSSYIETWLKDAGAKALPLAFPTDACMEFQFGPGHRHLWERNKAGYRKRSQLTGMTGDAMTRIKADGKGRIEKTVAMRPNSVSLIEIR